LERGGTSFCQYAMAVWHSSTFRQAKGRMQHVTAGVHVVSICHQLMP